MSKLPLDQSIKRFQGNDERMDVFANGTNVQSYQTSSGSSVPSVRKFLKDKDDEINAAADSILSGSEAARDAAQASALSASIDAASVAAQVDALAAPGGAATIGTIPAGGLSAANVQAALNELDSEKATVVNLALKAPIDSPTFTGTVGGITKAMVGLGNVDNTFDVDKPVSLATSLLLDLKEVFANKDASNGYVGLDLFKIKMRNAANTFTSFFTNSATAARTWTLPDKSGTVAMLDDVASGMLLIGEIVLASPTATIDFLNVFSSAYDNYKILITGIYTASGATSVQMRYAVAGSVDATNNYGRNPLGVSISLNQTSFYLVDSTASATTMASADTTVYGVNSTTSQYKRGTTTGLYNISGNIDHNGYYRATPAALSGFRLFSLSGTNFESGATVRVYGYKKA